MGYNLKIIQEMISKIVLPPLVYAQLYFLTVLAIYINSKNNAPIRTTRSYVLFTDSSGGGLN